MLVSSIIVAHDRITSNCNNIFKYTKYNCNNFEYFNENFLNIRSSSLKDDCYILFWKTENFTIVPHCTCKMMINCMEVGTSFFFTKLVLVHCSAYLLEFLCTGAFSRICNVIQYFLDSYYCTKTKEIYESSET